VSLIVFDTKNVASRKRITKELLGEKKLNEKKSR